jgi:hypothetical protein
VVVILSLVGSTFTYIQTTRTEKKLADTAACLAKYNDANQRNLLERSELARRQIENTNLLFSSLGESREDNIKAYQRYLVVAREIEKEKAQNPIAPPPSEICR